MARFKSKTEYIRIRGAKVHNLKNINLDIPKNKLVVITGLSGSGKSSLAFDAIYAEAERRFVESLSAYARQFLGVKDKPDVESIEGLSPAISIDQRTVSKNPRSTVGTITEIYDYLRILFARIGKPHCQNCEKPVGRQTVDQIVSAIERLPQKREILILAPLVSGKKGEHKEIMEEVKRAGFIRARVDGELMMLDEALAANFDKNKKHSIEVVVDRFVLDKDIERSRIRDSVETALKIGKGLAIAAVSNQLSAVSRPKAESRKPKAGNANDLVFSEKFACVSCGVNLPEIEPRTFSFNSPYGACSACTGLGSTLEADPELVIPNKRLTIAEGAIRPWASVPRRFAPGSRSPFGDLGTSHRLGRQSWYWWMLEDLAQRHGFSLNTPAEELPARILEIILYGEAARSSNSKLEEGTFEGVVPNLKRRWKETDSDFTRAEIEKYMIIKICPDCLGRRLRKEALAVKIGSENIASVTERTVEQAEKFFENLLSNRSIMNSRISANNRRPQQSCGVFLDGIRVLKSDDTLGVISSASSLDKLGTSLRAGIHPRSRAARYSARDNKNSGLISEAELKIAAPLVREISKRLQFLKDVGLEYLTLSRESTTLAGGETQRIQLATQIGSRLTGIIYILDEPSIGLHPRDQSRLIATLKNLRDLGNTVIVVEHDAETMRQADWIIDLGPGAGRHGGKVIFQGTPRQLLKASTLTGDYLAGRKQVTVTANLTRPGLVRNLRDQVSKYIVIKGASEHNLKNIDVKIPLGKFVCISGVSGSGKSTLMNDILAKAMLAKFYRAHVFPGKHRTIEGTENLNKVAVVDQSPIGRTPRSNPATYTGAFGFIRSIFARTHDARAMGYNPGRFSFNVKGGRCETCEGQGVKKIEMYFLPDVYVECEECRGKRYNKEALEIEYNGKNIAAVLDMTVEEALRFFEAIPLIRAKLETLNEVGLGYIKLGQPAPTLSGGEAQRVKLAAELSRRDTGKTLYILDEPTTGLHFDDIKKLLTVLHALVDRGNTVLIIEHNLDVLKNGDWIIDLGPEGGEKGGEIIAEGRPEDIAAVKKSYTGQWLSRLL